MNRKPTFAEKFLQFINGKGFYVVVLVCVAAIGISGFYLLRSMSGGEDDAAVSGTASVTVTPSAQPSASASPQPSREIQTSASPSPTPSASEPAEDTAADEEPSQEPVSTQPAALVYTWPVKGEVLADFSLETLAYDETMGDWRTHSGIDVAAAQGTDVLATADGTVSEIYDDDLMGTTVVIDHGQGMVSTYSNLQTQPTVAVGDTVRTGTIIGAVGSTAIAESGRASHLHFELAQDGMAVDPLLYLPAQT